MTAFTLCKTAFTLCKTAFTLCKTGWAMYDAWSQAEEHKQPNKLALKRAYYEHRRTCGKCTPPEGENNGD